MTGTSRVPTTAVVRPADRLAGRLRVPGDKSVSHRALMLGGLCSGLTEVTGLLDSADVRSTATAMAALGVEVKGVGAGTVSVCGRGAAGLSAPAADLDCGNSGTTMRLLAGLLAGQGIGARLVGDASLSRRPMKRVVTPLEQMGLRAAAEGEGGRPPLVIGAQDGPPRGIAYKSPIASGQVKSCVLLAGLRCREPVSLEEPAPSRDHTERLLRYLGFRVESSANYEHPDGEAAWVVLRPAPGFVPTARPIAVPGDISSAAFWLVAAALTGSPGLVLEGVSLNPTRTGILDALAAMGLAVRASEPRVLPGGEPVGDLSLEPGGRPRGAVVGGGLIPRLIDEIPVLAVLATTAEGETVIRDARELRVKESDRLAASARLLRAAGAEVEEREDGLAIRGPVRLRAFEFDAQGDHRLAMAAAVAALVADGPCTIHSADACAVSYGEFFDHLAAVAPGSWAGA